MDIGAFAVNWVGIWVGEEQMNTVDLERSQAQRRGSPIMSAVMILGESGL
jgi:hypothetical protein